MIVCSNCGDKCCDGIKCYYKDWDVDLIPQGYEWKCPKCNATNYVMDETYPEYTDCYECGQEVKLNLKDMKR
jgi:hypothetical protein